jgi:acyl-CoA thioesterase-1
LHRLLVFISIAPFLLLVPPAAVPLERPVKIVVLGDSLVAGYGIHQQDAFPSALQRVLHAKGINVQIMNAGVSGDTTSVGLFRLDRSVPQGTDAVILELGTNDARLGVAPDVTRSSLEEILRRLRSRDIDVLVCGARAYSHASPYANAFNTIFSEVAGENRLILYPYFLEGVEGNPNFTLDGLHPNPAGVGEILTRVLPKVEELIARVRARLNPA